MKNITEESESLLQAIDNNDHAKIVEILVKATLDNAKIEDVLSDYEIVSSIKDLSLKREVAKELLDKNVEIFIKIFSKNEDDCFGLLYEVSKMKDGGKSILNALSYNNLMLKKLISSESYYFDLIINIKEVDSLLFNYLSNDHELFDKVISNPNYLKKIINIKGVKVDDLLTEDLQGDHELFDKVVSNPQILKMLLHIVDKILPGNDIIVKALLSTNNNIIFEDIIDYPKSLKVVLDIARNNEDIDFLIHKDLAKNILSAAESGKLESFKLLLGYSTKVPNTVGEILSANNYVLLNILSQYYDDMDYLSAFQYAFSILPKEKITKLDDKKLIVQFLRCFNKLDDIANFSKILQLIENKEIFEESLSNFTLFNSISPSITAIIIANNNEFNDLSKNNIDPIKSYREIKDEVKKLTISRDGSSVSEDIINKTVDEVLSFIGFFKSNKAFKEEIKLWHKKVNEDFSKDIQYFVGLNDVDLGLLKKLTVHQLNDIYLSLPLRNEKLTKALDGHLDKFISSLYVLQNTDVICRLLTDISSKLGNKIECPQNLELYFYPLLLPMIAYKFPELTKSLLIGPSLNALDKLILPHIIPYIASSAEIEVKYLAPIECLVKGGANAFASLLLSGNPYLSLISLFLGTTSCIAYEYDYKAVFNAINLTHQFGLLTMAYNVEKPLFMAIEGLKTVYALIDLYDSNIIKDYKGNYYYQKNAITINESESKSYLDDNHNEQVMHLSPDL